MNNGTDMITGAPDAQDTSESSEKKPRSARRKGRFPDGAGVTVNVDNTTKAILKELEAAVSTESILLKLGELEERFDELEERTRRMEKLLKEILEAVEDGK